MADTKPAPVDSAKADNATEAAAHTQSSAERLLSTVSQYANAEFEGTRSEYALLTKLNNAAAGEYGEWTEKLAHANDSALQLQQTYEEVQPALQLIDNLATSVETLLGTAQQLDEFSRELEARLRQATRAKN
ncbi:uncharacterized protein MONBRDRAFT_25966 [Monosiga brevicollis MX1]|uniref:Biogenesis of lysosome-related organelles complex 1 subunit 2 n=1 Tax=Monosiga brevicollis TaxID=81824 RepID=A9V0Z7_MONBE|nr:uncharacterized protein MONBRDRAFT_25966 [Monosiga brevicollis MX1]EDQ88844.1 predicted protein [Monosiga brevicollis MX1]|eukprot:XP_001746457.1 hypothetical protein [Monosiga brevicollis MX1]